MQELNGKVALITGAASGIGRGLVNAAAAAGMAIIVADVDSERLGTLDESLDPAGVQRLTCTLDIRDRATLAAALGPATPEALENLPRVEADVVRMYEAARAAGASASTA